MPAIAADSHFNLNNYDTPDRGFLYRPDITYNWGHLSPFHSMSSEYNPSTPLPGCTVTFVQSLTRHGSRYPTLGNKYNTILQRIQSSVNNYGPGFEFIQNYKTNIPLETLNGLGRHQSINAGMHFYRRYQSLAKNNQPFIRYDEAERVVESGEKWAYGFHLASLADKTRIGPDDFPYPTVKLPAGKEYNNTLNNRSCPKRDEVTDHSEWQAFNRYHSERKWYTYFYGNPLAPSLGVGWVNELIARLLQRPVRDSTSTNTTLTANPETFPMNKRLYADFTHATDFVQIYAALGLLVSTHNPVPANRIVSNQRHAEFSISEVAPFAARMYIEKMTCSGQKEELVRILVNNRVMWLPNCGVDEEGRCKLGAFVESLSFARSGGFWKKCF
ncbi:uncharacterized protein PgNI_12345 [Pyricularia grisea]|uniref:3-phytase n=1 Tax=Pyricularia grisea TaxID=148305 RepID=A0A6P8AN14_PYRGI